MKTGNVNTGNNQYKGNNYQLSLTDRHDKIVLYWPSVGDLRYYQLSWQTTVQFITLGATTFLELSRQHVPQSICCGEIFKVRSLEKSSRRKYPYVCRCLNFFKTSCRTGQKKPPCQNQIILSICLDRKPTCDRQTDRHRVIASTCASIASCG